jgi:hypothetical protein
MRRPVVAGVGGGVGTTTLAVALRGRDGGREALGRADILACRGTADSLARVADALDRPWPGARPVVAVTLGPRRLDRGPFRARLDLLDRAAEAVVLLPHVARWQTLADPLADAVGLLADPSERRSRSLRAYAAALHELAAAVVASGRLDSPAGSDERRTNGVPIRDGSAAVPARAAADAPPRRPVGVRIVPPPVRPAHVERVETVG